MVLKRTSPPPPHRQGWRYGAVRNSETKTNPLLVPFDELDPSNQETNRTQAMSTIYKICEKNFTFVMRVRSETP